MRVFNKKEYILIFSIIFVYYLVALLFTVNFPISDDYALIDFINNWIKTNSFSEKVALLFEPHNEHIIFTTKLIFLLYYKILGPLNFIHLSFIGNLTILGIFYIIKSQLPQSFNKRTLIIIMITSILFQYGSAESMLWAMAAISNYSVLLYVLITLVLLRREDIRSFILAVIFATLAAYTQGNGLVIFIIGVLYLLSQRRYLFLVFWVFIAIGVYSAYFQGFTIVENHSNPFNYLANLGTIVLYAFAFLGSAFGIGGSHYPILSTVFLVPTIIIGASLVLITIFFFYKKTYKDGNIFIWINLFIIITSFLTALSRNNFGLSQALVSRYHINSSLIIISTIILLVQYFEANKIKNPFPKIKIRLITYFFVIYSLSTFPMILYFSYKVYRPIQKGEIIFPRKPEALNILKNAERNNVFIVKNKSSNNKKKHVQR